MNAPTFLIDTNIFIELEDPKEVPFEYAEFARLASRHGLSVLVHQASAEDIARDKDAKRRGISQSKFSKFESIGGLRGRTEDELAELFGPLKKPNDVVDATLLDALGLGVVDFLVTQDVGLHDRAEKYAPALASRVLFVADAEAWIRTTYEPHSVSLPFVEEVEANTIPITDKIFETLPDSYDEFIDWWKKSCVAQRRKVWIVSIDGQIAGLIVRKDETAADTDATLAGQKILKLCTFRVRPEFRGVKLGELLLKQAIWFAQKNNYNLMYLTVFQQKHPELCELIEYFGFAPTVENARGEMTFEKIVSREALVATEGDLYDLARSQYPRFSAGSAQVFGVPIKAPYHDILFPELKDRSQLSLFDLGAVGDAPRTPGNTIRKVYLCRAQANILQRGAILLFYRGKSDRGLSQAMTTVGIFESMTLAKSTEELMRLAGSRSVYSEQQLRGWNAKRGRPVKVINFLLCGHIDPPLGLSELTYEQIFKGHPPQSIWQLDHSIFERLKDRLNLGFDLQ